MGAGCRGAVREWEFVFCLAGCGIRGKGDKVAEIRVGVRDSAWRGRWNYAWLGVHFVWWDGRYAWAGVRFVWWDGRYAWADVHFL